MKSSTSLPSCLASSLGDDGIADSSGQCSEQRSEMDTPNPRAIASTVSSRGVTSSDSFMSLLSVVGGTPDLRQKSDWLIPLRCRSVLMFAMNASVALIFYLIEKAEPAFIGNGLKRKEAKTACPRRLELHGLFPLRMLRYDFLFSLNQPVTNVEPQNTTPPPPAHSGAQMAKPASARAPRGCRGAERQGGRAQRASSSDWPELFERSAQRARSEFEGPTLPRAPQGSHAKGMTTRVAPEPMPAQPCPALPRQSAQQTNK